MASVLTSPQLATQRLPGQWSKSYLAIPEAHTIYTARLNGVPATNDMVAEITVDTESGTRANVLADMTLYVGTTLGGYELGMCRIRKTPIAGIFYLGETSEVVWADNAYLTVVDDYQLWAKLIRVVSDVPYMDWDVTYTNQHENFDPVPCMGSDAVAKLTGATVNVNLGPSADVPSWVHGSTISSVLWTIAGATAIDNNAIVNPVATFNAVGTYLAYYRVTAANGKIFTGVRYIIIWNEANPPLKNFKIQSGRMNYETGACSFSVVLFSGFDQVTLRKRSKVILCTEDFAENQAVIMAGQIPGRENILCEGWISNIDTSRQAEYGEISFTVESAEYWFKKIRDYPTGLELQNTSAVGWTIMPAMTVDRALWHFLHWRSTATRIMDVKLTGDTRLATRFHITNSNLWERMDVVSKPTIFAAPGVDNFGRLFVQIEPQMVPEAERTWPVVMTITDADLDDGISWRRRDVAEISMLFLSGISVAPDGTPSSFFSMSPGHSYGHYGEEEPQDNYLVSSQAQSNELCGLYYGWKNNDPYDLEMNFAHSMRVLGMYPRQKYAYTVSPANDPRGIGFTKNFMVREIGFDQDVDTGFIGFSALLEPESVPGPAIDGDVPTMENIDFSIPDLPSLPNLPSLPTLPYIVLPPTLEPTIQPVRVVIGSSKGVFYTETFDQSGNDVIWKSMNNGLTLAEYTSIEKLVVTPSGALFILEASGRKIYCATSLGGTWFEIANVVAVGMGVNPTVNEKIGFYGGTYGAMQFYTADRNGSTAGFGGMTLRNTVVGDVVFTNNRWIILGSKSSGVFATPWYYLADPSGSSTLGNGSANTAVGQDFSTRHVIRAGGNDLAYMWDASGAGGFNKITVGGTVYTRLTSLTPVNNHQGMAASPTGTHLMACGGTTPYKSTDSGASWSSAAGVIPLGSDIWENCGDDYRWIFGGGIIIRLTMDQGASYVDKMGNLLTIAALIDITQIRYMS